jgi:hypothetical protein
MHALAPQRVVNYGGLCTAGLVILLSLLVHGVVLTGVVLGLIVLVLALM